MSKSYVLGVFNNKIQQLKYDILTLQNEGDLETANIYMMLRDNLIECRDLVEEMYEDREGGEY